MEGKYILKIIIVGDAAVGKTSLVRSFIQEKFKTEYLPTLGVDIYHKQLTINNKVVDLSIWDIAGQKGWELMHRNYFRGADGCIAVFDLTRIKTLENLKSWILKVREYSKPDIPCVVLGNKSDLKVAIEVTDSKIEKIMKEIGCTYYFETSAKTGEKVDEAFTSLVKSVINKLKPR
ncbi:MAG: GTP-binding protein [Candidatus Odinarchaeum yellowstonii]|uniref:GTP-binding protein n=1 Tax=Odinarchaeota yellowstonii (strain LCB_4) TaxID=1841599 RepID=A0AAF0D2D8_ODILC|nr:MAG: GTP-binding protein [Candidatus Odinarchaeum yellowstonii]